MNNKIILLKSEQGDVESCLKYFLEFNASKDLRILDIGCNNGSLIFNLYKQGYNVVYGVDVNEKAISIGKREYKEISSNLQFYNGKNLPFEKEKFDIILMFNVLEHIPNTERYLKEEVYRVLKEGGMFIFQTPNKLINIPWELIKAKSLFSWREEHCSLQTLKSLKKILLNSGFRDIIIEKNNILSVHNKAKTKRKVGVFNLPMLFILQKMPLFLYPNFWGYCKKMKD